MSRTLIIAEIGSVHDGNFDSAKQLIELAQECGADVVKFQTHIAAAETLRDAPMPPYFKGEPRYEYFERTGFTLEQWKELKAHSDKTGIEFLSSPFSLEAVDLLEQVGVKRYKIPSGEISNIPLLEHVAQTRKQVILSSGMSSWEELDEAVKTIQAVHNDIVILQCTTEYPCPYEEVGLNIMTEMHDRYHLPVGFSDHTLTIFAPLAAVTQGATVIEKHLTSSRSLYGSDAKHSLEPGEFKQMVEGIRAVDVMKTTPLIKDSARYAEMKVIFEKSIVAAKDIAAGTVLTKEHLAYKKPGSGTPARQYREFVGKKITRDIKADEFLYEKDLA